MQRNHDLYYNSNSLTVRYKCGTICCATKIGNLDVYFCIKIKLNHANWIFLAFIITVLFVCGREDLCALFSLLKCNYLCLHQQKKIDGSFISPKNNFYSINKYGLDNFVARLPRAFSVCKAAWLLLLTTIAGLLFHAIYYAP